MHSLHDAPDLAQDAPDLDPVEARAAAVLALLTLDEKIAMLHQAAPAVERLGLAPFRTGTEALHGVSWLGTATVFPQPVGLAAAWDEDLLTRVGDAVATEVRAKHAADPTVSLNVWAPVVNPLRHPLWGRGEEGFSEDPHLTAELATAYARGLRGTHPTVWKTVPTLKHFLGYSNEVDRSVTRSHLPPQALREYELPAYRGAVASGAVGAVMPSYNLVNGRPNHVARELLDDCGAGPRARSRWSPTPRPPPTWSSPSATSRRTPRRTPPRCGPASTRSPTTTPTPASRSSASRRRSPPAWSARPTSTARSCASSSCAPGRASSPHPTRTPTGRSAPTRSTCPSTERSRARRSRAASSCSRTAGRCRSLPPRPGSRSSAPTPTGWSTTGTRAHRRTPRRSPQLSSRATRERRSSSPTAPTGSRCAPARRVRTSR